MAVLIAISTAMVVMVIQLARIVCSRLKYESLGEDDQFLRALKQLLPLAAFPI